MSLPNVVTSIGPVKAHVRPVAEEIAQRWVVYFIWGAPGRGTGDHAQGLALDFMTYDLGGGVDNPGPLRDGIGHAIASYVLANRVRLNVTYVIWQRKIASAASNPPWSWRTYTGSNPHIDHVHVSFEEDGTYHPPEDDDMTPEQAKQLREVHAMLTALPKEVWDHALAAKGPWKGLKARDVVVGDSGKSDAAKRRDLEQDAKLAHLHEDVEEISEQIAVEGA